MTATCDYLTNCGDDPRVKDGKVRPCEYHQRRVAEAAQLLADVVLLTAFARSSRNPNVSAALARVLPKVRP